MLHFSRNSCTTINTDKLLLVATKDIICLMLDTEFQAENVSSVSTCAFLPYCNMLVFYFPTVSFLRNPICIIFIFF